WDIYLTVDQDIARFLGLCHVPDELNEGTALLFYHLRLVAYGFWLLFSPLIMHRILRIDWYD
ncbi:MAG: hypothetical protein AAF335_04970, partial [Bacteroidota bacterium]